MDLRLDASDSFANPLVEAMVAAWQQGERPLAETFLVDEIDDEAAIRLIFEEFCLRQEVGMAVDPADFAARFPRLWPELELLLDCQRLMEADPTSTAALPEEGDEPAGFRLLRELGRGVVGKVFLASETALADRPVVVKVAPIGRAEHLSLARLQHMNIVPLYSAQVLHDRSLQVLCMPFLGGASLAQVLEILKGVEPSKRLGSQVIEAIDRVEASLPVRLEARGPFRRHIARSSYVETIAWIGLCLAEGLRYAHDRDFVHMDIKPSNVLIAGDGQPMLLDFHLAREPIAPGDLPPAQIGGTPGYMAPEQILALTAVAEGREIASRVDGRADLFSLALILDEALGGSHDAGRRTALHRRNPRVPVGLSDIIDRCLEADPAARYPDAASLAADLRRFLDGLPLRGVPNRSVSERWRNWRRRRPHALIRMVILAVATVVACSALALLRAGYLQRVHEAAVRQELAAGLARSRRQANIEELHRLAELVWFRYGIDRPSPDEARALIRRGEEIWRDRRQFLKPTDDPQSEPIIRADLLDFTLAWVHFRVRLAPTGETEAARHEALRVLDEAEVLLGPCAAIDRERQTSNGLGGSLTSLTSPPRTPREHFDLGQSYLRSGETLKAAEQFRLGLLLRPQDFWLNFYQGLAAYRLGRFDEAVNAFRVAIALSPESAECFYNRALAEGSLGRSEEAIGDYTRALELNPALGIAALNRGMLHYKKGQLAEASSDLRRALASVTGSSDRGMIHFNLGLIELAGGDKAAALDSLDLAVGLGNEAARTLRDRLQVGAVVKPE